MSPLTTRQNEVLSYIVKYTKKETYPPTIREIAQSFHISVKAVQDHVTALKKKGALQQKQGHCRSLVVQKKSKTHLSPVSIPLLGVVSAGTPIFAEQNIEKHIHLSKDIVGSKNCFALKVKGESMKDAGILPGDIAIIEIKNDASNGDIVVALLDDSVTIKRFFKDNHRITLEPENKDYSPIYCQDVKILGTLCAILRKY